MTAAEIAVVAGIDTHTDLHQAAVIDTVGRQLATEAFATTPEGDQELLDWLRFHAQVLAVGVEGTGAFGAGLARILSANDVTVAEVDRPDSKARRGNGKSDPIDAYAAPVAAPSSRLVGRLRRATGSWRRSGPLRIARKSAAKARTQTINQIRTLIVTAPSRSWSPCPVLPYRRRHGQEGHRPVPETVRRPRDLPPPIPRDPRHHTAPTDQLTIYRSF
ncbi:IS110 family transposase [Streptomyces regalis]|uniref:IS110 family transposase n=1 Tax=Streptomyces regalis TaxID=68262 RepID=UPI0007885701|nr:IS110 family transposase [Streptomyces regalis]